MEAIVRQTNAAKRAAVMDSLSDPERAGWSDHEIARHAGVSHRYVGLLRQKLAGGNVSTSSPPPLQDEPPPPFHPMAVLLASAGVPVPLLQSWQSTDGLYITMTTGGPLCEAWRCLWGNLEGVLQMLAS